MDQLKIKGTNRLWIFIPIVFPIFAGLYVNSQLKWNTQVERFHKDPLTFILVGLFVYSVFFLFPVLLSMTLRTVIVDQDSITIRYLVTRKTVVYLIKDIKFYKSGTEQVKGIDNNTFDIVFKNGKRDRLTSLGQTNFKKMVNHIECAYSSQKEVT